MNAPETTEQLNQQIAADYDTQPYRSNAFFSSSPGHIRAAAHLYGVDTVPLERARVLELGCAAGGNLLPFALSYPDATVVGVDLSAVQVEHGRQVVSDLGLRNMALHAMSLTEITPDFGQFDYIIAHGVFSWVPLEVKQAMLRICRENLSPQGLAYISYNTYPGWKAGDIVRDAMQLHSHGAADDKERLARAKAMLMLFSQGLSDQNPLAPSLRRAAASLGKQADYYIAHEYLETFNTPCYFVEFADAATQAGLAYVGDAEPNVEVAATYGANVQMSISLIALGQPKELRQQYLDFAVGRNFRRSLLVRQERAAEILSTPDLGRLRELQVAGHFTLMEAKPDQPASIPTYRNQRARQVGASEPAIGHIIEALSQAWPGSLSWDALCARVAGKIPEAAEEALFRALETLFRTGAIHLSRGPGPYDGKPAAGHPMLIPGFAYLHGRNVEPGFGIGCFNLWHDAVRISMMPAQEFTLSLLDGQVSLAKVRMAMRQALQQGKVSLHKDEWLTGQRNLDPTAQKVMNSLLPVLHERGLLMGYKK